MYKVKNTGGDANYTNFQKVHAGESFRKILRPNVKGVVYDLDKTPSRPDLDPTTMNPESYKTEKDHLVPKEAEYVRNNCDEIVKKIVDDRVEFTAKADQKKLDALGKKYNPDYKPLTASEKREREKMSAEIRRKYAEATAKHTIAENYANRAFTGDLIYRTNRCLLNFDLSNECFDRNDEIKKYLNSSDPKEKAKAYAMKLEDLCNIDLTKINPTDDKYILDHFEELADLVNVAPEMAALFNEYQKLSGEDFSTEEYKPIVEKLGALSDIGIILKTRMDVMCSPVYSQIRTEDLLGNPDFIDNPDDPYELDQALFGDGETNNVIHSALYQIQFYNQDHAGNPLIDTNLTPEQRLIEHSAHYWDKDVYHEIKPLKKPEEKKVEEKPQEVEPKAEEKQVKQEPVQPKIEPIVLPDINLGRTVPKDAHVDTMEDEYDDFELSNDANKLKDEELTNEDIEQIKTDVANDPVSPEEAMLRRNIQKIREVIPEFVLTEKEIKAYFTPEREQIRENAFKYIEKKKQCKATVTGIPSSYVRVADALKKGPSDPEAAEHNEWVEEMLIDPTSKGDEFRKNLTVNLVNEFSKLDKNNFGGKPFAEIAQYTQQDEELYDIGMDFQKTMADLKRSMGFEFDKTYSKDLKNIEDKAVCLGAVGKGIRKIASSNYYYTFPYEQLSSEQLGILMESNLELEGLGTQELADIFGISMQMNQYNDFKEPEGREYTANDTKDTIPNLEDVQKQCKASLEKLEAAKSKSSLTNSTQYINMVKSLHEVLDVIEKKDDNPEFTNDFSKALGTVSGRSKEYIKHVGAKGKNATQQTRLDAANEISDYISDIGADINSKRIAENYKEQKLLAAEAKKAKEQAKKATPEDIEHYKASIESGIQQQRDRIAATLEKEKNDPAREMNPNKDIDPKRKETLEKSYANIMTYKTMEAKLDKDGTNMTKDQLKAFCNNSYAKKSRDELMKDPTFIELCKIVNIKDYEAMAENKVIEHSEYYMKMFKAAEKKAAEVTNPQKSAPEKTAQQTAKSL